MPAFEDTIEWNSKGSFADPNADITEEIEWTAEGGFLSGVSWSGTYADWDYRKAITLDNQSGGVLTDYQLLITLTTGNFDYSHCENDGKDIRFSQDDETTALSYWIEDWNYEGTSKIWVKVDSIPTGESICLYLYYGNNAAASESNAANAFPQFVENKTSAFCEALLFNTGYAFMMKVTMPDNSHSQHFGMAISAGDWSNSMYIFYPHSSGNAYAYTKNGANTTEGAPFAYSAGTYIWEAKYKTGEIKYYRDDALKDTITTNLPTLDMGLYMWEAGGANCTIVWGAVRKYVSPEPTSEIGGEEEPGSVSVTGIYGSSISWDAKAEFDTPTIAFISSISWDAKGSFICTTQAAYLSDIEWTAKGEFTPPHVFIFIDLR